MSHWLFLLLLLITLSCPSAAAYITLPLPAFRHWPLFADVISFSFHAAIADYFCFAAADVASEWMLFFQHVITPPLLAYFAGQFRRLPLFTLFMPFAFIFDYAFLH